MRDIEKCVICNNEITNTMVLCPNCGNVINRADYSENRVKYNYTLDKNIESLEKIDMALCHLEEELDAFLCKKR